MHRKWIYPNEALILTKKKKEENHNFPTNTQWPKVI